MSNILYCKSFVFETLIDFEFVHDPIWIYDEDYSITNIFFTSIHD